jgi:hypothetical protein
MAATFQNSAQVLSIGIFFTLIIIGLSAALPHSLRTGLVAQGVPSAYASKVAHLPAVDSLFAAFLGFNPIKTLLGPILPTLSHAKVAYLTGRAFFPQLISAPFMSGLREAFDFAIAASLIATIASWMRGGKYIHEETPPAAPSRLVEIPAEHAAEPAIVMSAKLPSGPRPTSPGPVAQWNEGGLRVPEPDR